MATAAGPFIAITVTTAAPSGAPAEVFSDIGPDRWELLLGADGGDLTLTASAFTPAQLWGYDRYRARWRLLEEVWRTTEVVVVDGTDKGDQAQFAAPGIVGLHVTYPAIVDAGSAVYLARTVREVQP